MPKKLPHNNKSLNDKLFNGKPFGEETEAIATRLPRTLIELIERGVAKKVFATRSDGLRILALAGANTKRIQRLGIEENNSFATSVAALAQFAAFKSSRDSIQKSLLLLEEPLAIAIKAKESAEVHEILASVENTLKDLSPFWQSMIRQHLESSPVFVTAYQRFRRPKTG